MANLVIPSTAPAGTYVITVTATDGLGAMTSTTVTVVIGAAAVGQAINPIYTLALPDDIDEIPVVSLTVIADALDIPVLEIPVVGLTQLESIVCAVGGMVLGGSASTDSANVAAVGGMVLGGSASTTLSTVSNAVGGMVLGGSASPSLTTSVNAVGGMVLGGSATVSSLDWDTLTEAQWDGLTEADWDSLPAANNS